jgi:hypothetical protein
LSQFLDWITQRTRFRTEIMSPDEFWRRAKTRT